MVHTAHSLAYGYFAFRFTYLFGSKADFGLAESMGA